MRIPRHWVRGEFTGPDRTGRQATFLAWGWSFESLAAARADAVARARRVFDFITAGRKPDEYAYLEQPLREEIIQSVQAEGKDVGVITRNRYGALVLNCPSVLFADVDFPPGRSAGLLDALAGLFSPARRRQRAEAAQEATLAGVRRWLAANSSHACRVYRTRAGLRLLFVDGLYEPTSAQTVSILKGLGSDKLYCRLTARQECFRARLTPKPWRCGLSRPPNRYPWLDQTAENAYRQWERRYAEKAKGRRICELLETLGHAQPNEQVAAIIAMHDQYCCQGAKGELA
jgi:hypothetical protein